MRSCTLLPDFCKSLLNIFNNVFNQGFFPAPYFRLRKERIPLGLGSKSVRPIALLSCLLKIFERFTAYFSERLNLNSFSLSFSLVSGVLAHVPITWLPSPPASTPLSYAGFSCCFSWYRERFWQYYPKYFNSRSSSYWFPGTNLQIHRESSVWTPNLLYPERRPAGPPNYTKVHSRAQSLVLSYSIFILEIQDASSTTTHKFFNTQTTL